VGTFVQFSSPTYSVNEADGTAIIDVTLNASSTQPITVSYTTINGSAIAGQDYTAASGSLTFPAGITTQEIKLGIIDDTLDEVDETLSVKLSSPVKADLGIPGEAILTIKDDDPAPSVSFNPGSYDVSESGVTVTSTVHLTAASSKPITISYSTSDGTATQGVDYTAVSGSIMFTPGMTVMSIQIPILADTLYEGDETFTLSLSNPINATLASPSIATFKIIDFTRRIYLPITVR
jgi:hypothetical protein